MQLQAVRDTRCELALRSLLWRSGLRYLVDRRPDPALRRKADLVFPRAKVAVFIDGCFWHWCKVHGRIPAANRVWWKRKLSTTQKRDRDTTQRLRAKGWAVIRVWEHDRAATAARRIVAAVRART